MNATKRTYSLTRWVPSENVTGDWCLESVAVIEADSRREAMKQAKKAHPEARFSGGSQWERWSLYEKNAQPRFRGAK